MRAMSIRKERQLAIDLSPAVAWPTLRLAILLPAAQVGLIAGALGGWWPPWAATLPLGYVVFANYTLVHESIHGNVVRHSRFRWVHELLGWWGSVNMMASYPALRRIHLLHHQRTNTGDDPDYNLCRGPLWKSLARMIYLRTLLLLPLPVVKRIPKSNWKAKKATPRELRQHEITLILIQLLIWTMVAAGYWQAVLFLFWIPMLLGCALLNIFFQWVPHVPFDKTDRYGQARVSDWPFGDRILFGQNLHLGHHLWPCVPYYHYRRLNDALRPQFESMGARLDGFMPAPGWRARTPPAGRSEAPPP